MRATRADHRGRVRHLCRPHAGRTLVRGRGPAEVLAALLDACTPSWADAYDDFLARRLRPGETVEEYLQVLRGLVALFINGPVPDSLLDMKFMSGRPEGARARLRIKVGTRSERKGLRELHWIVRDFQVTVDAAHDPFVADAGQRTSMPPPARGRHGAARRAVAWSISRRIAIQSCLSIEQQAACYQSIRCSAPALASTAVTAAQCPQLLRSSPVGPKYIASSKIRPL